MKLFNYLVYFALTLPYIKCRSFVEEFQVEQQTNGIGNLISYKREMFANCLNSKTSISFSKKQLDNSLKILLLLQYGVYDDFNKF